MRLRQPSTTTAGTPTTPADAAVVTTPPAPVDDPLALARRAEARGDLALAAAAYETAYRTVSTPDLLYRIGELHERLGDKAKARDAYERYLTAKPDAVDREHVKTRIAQLTPPVTGTKTSTPRPRAKTPEATATKAQVCGCHGAGADTYIRQICSALRRGGPACTCSKDHSDLCSQRWTSLDENGNVGSNQTGVSYMLCVDMSRSECIPRAGMEPPLTCGAVLRSGVKADESCTGWTSRNDQVVGTVQCDYCQWGVARFHGKNGDPCKGFAYDTGTPLSGTMYACTDHPD
jgi:hypothetical protein